MKETNANIFIFKLFLLTKLMLHKKIIIRKYVQWQLHLQGIGQ